MSKVTSSFPHQEHKGSALDVVRMVGVVGAGVGRVAVVMGWAVWLALTPLSRLSKSFPP